MLIPALGVPKKSFVLTVSIVAYKTDLQDLKLAIGSCLAASMPTQVILVDNSPSANLAGPCQELGAVYVKTASNIGFGAAHNIALGMSGSSKYHLVMNADVRFGPGSLEELTSFLDLNPSIGMVMPRVLNTDGSHQHLCKRLPTPIDMLARGLLPKALRMGGSQSTFELQDMDMRKVLSVPYLSGCFMMLRTTALKTTGVFDEEFFMYFEDLDLSRRMHQFCDTAYYPGLTITHRHARGSHKSAWLFLCGLRSAVRYFQKWGWIRDRQRAAVNRAVGPLTHLKLPGK